MSSEMPPNEIGIRLHPQPSSGYLSKPALQAIYQVPCSTQTLARRLRRRGRGNASYTPVLPDRHLLSVQLPHQLRFRRNTFV